MKRVILFIVMLFPFIYVNAEECSKEKIEELKGLAENVTINTEYDYESRSEGFYQSNIINVYGLTEDLYVASRRNEIIIDSSFIEPEKGVASRTSSLGLDEFYVYSLSCRDVKLKKIDVEVYYYNIYSEEKECEGLEEKLDICREFYDTKGISYDKFIEIVNDYKNKKNKISFDNETDNNIYFIILGILSACIIIGIVIYFVYRHKKNKLD